MQVQKQLLQELGHEPTPEEVANEMGLPLDKVQSIMKMAQQPISLQSPVGDSDDTNFGDFIEDKGAENPYDMTAYSLLREKILDVLDSLTERERNVLSLRFGLKDGYSRTLEEVGKQFKVTRERIRQIEAKALRKMRHPTRIRQLHGFSKLIRVPLTNPNPKLSGNSVYKVLFFCDRRPTNKLPNLISSNIFSHDHITSTHACLHRKLWRWRNHSYLSDRTPTFRSQEST